MASYQHLIADYGSAEGLVVTNPATGDQLATVPSHTSQDVEDAIAAAGTAYKSWSKRSAKDRAAVLKTWHGLILQHQDALAELCTLECGKPIAESKGEVLYAASFVEWFAEEGKRMDGEILQTHAADKRLMVLKEPVGVAAAITPWNFPLAMITRKAAPALAAGCAFLVKPAEATPLSAYALETLALQAGIPSGLYRTLTTTTPASIGDIFCHHPTIKKLSFTGSTPVGKHLMREAASTVKRVSMELGGNAPFIVFDDADLDAAVAGVMASKYRNSGQTCVCANRILVQDGIHDAFVDALTAKIAALKVGNGLQDGIQIGPLINEAGLTKVDQLVTDATRKGAQSKVGGERAPGSGAFYQPTLLTGVTTDMDIAHNEIFGPVAPIIRFDTEQQAIDIANGTPFGLAAYFFSTDMRRVWRVMESLDYGMIGANEGIFSTETAPFGGVKESGIGREGSRHGLDEYIELKYVCLGGMA